MTLDKRFRWLLLTCFCRHILNEFRHLFFDKRIMLAPVSSLATAQLAHSTVDFNWKLNRHPEKQIHAFKIISQIWALEFSSDLIIPRPIHACTHYHSRWMKSIDFSIGIIICDEYTWNTHRFGRNHLFTCKSIFELMKVAGFS